MITTEIRDQYEVVIGIETHVQLKTKTKLFCGCDNDARDKEPNTVVCQVCLGLPGTLPVLNEQAVKLAIRAGLALGGEIAKQTKFDRKNYFYPDLPKGYQITQFDTPIVGKGYVQALVGDQSVRVGITRAHLEEDAGKLTHPAGADYSLVDLNRAGTPLLEIVSEPDMRSAVEAKAYAQEVYNLMRYADVSDVDLYYGNMRFDVNVSVRKRGAKEFGTRTETKNLNSFRAVEKTVEYEANRQIELIEKGEKIVQETRGWDDAKQRTFSQRSKEEAHDYRYFPEPDVPPIVVTDAMLKEAQDSVDLLPSDIREELATIGLSMDEIEVSVGEPEISIPFVKDLLQARKIEKEPAKLLGQNILNDAEVREALKKVKVFPYDDMLAAANATIATTISGTQFKQQMRSITIDGHAFDVNIKQVSDEGALLEIVKQVIADNPKPAEQYKAGDEKVLGFLVGQVMKASKGQANPPMVNELLKKELT